MEMEPKTSSNNKKKESKTSKKPGKTKFDVSKLPGPDYGDEIDKLTNSFANKIDISGKDKKEDVDKQMENVLLQKLKAAKEFREIEEAKILNSKEVKSSSMVTQISAADLRRNFRASIFKFFKTQNAEHIECYGQKIEMKKTEKRLFNSPEKYRKCRQDSIPVPCNSEAFQAICQYLEIPVSVQCVFNDLYTGMIDSTKDLYDTEYVIERMEQESWILTKCMTYLEDYQKQGDHNCYSYPDPIVVADFCDTLGFLHTFCSKIRVDKLSKEHRDEFWKLIKILFCPNAEESVQSFWGKLKRKFLMHHSEREKAIGFGEKDDDKWGNVYERSVRKMVHLPENDVTAFDSSGLIDQEKPESSPLPRDANTSNLSEMNTKGGAGINQETKEGSHVYCFGCILLVKIYTYILY